MPVDIETFQDKGTEVQKRPKEKWQTVIGNFLKENSEQAYTDKELTEEVGANTSATTNQATRALEKKGLVQRLNVEGKIHSMWIGGDKPVEDEDDEEEDAE